MSPLVLDAILHYHTTPGDYRDGDFSAPAVKEMISWMCDEALIVKHPNGSYKATERLHAVVKKLCSIELPELRWVYPEDLKA